MILDRLDAVEAVTDAPIGAVTADAGYACAKVLAGPETREITGVIPTKTEPIRSNFPLRRLHRDAGHELVECPREKTLRPPRPGSASGGSQPRWHAIAGTAIWPPSPSRVAKMLVIVHDCRAFLRARRRRDRRSEEDDRLYRRHRWRSGGLHGEAKTWHGLARAVHRGLDNMRIRSFLTAAAINLRRLAAAVLAVIRALIAQQDPRNGPVRAQTLTARLTAHACCRPEGPRSVGMDVVGHVLERRGRIRGGVLEGVERRRRRSGEQKPRVLMEIGLRVLRCRTCRDGMR